MSADRVPGFATLAVHAGAEAAPTAGPRPAVDQMSQIFDGDLRVASLIGPHGFGDLWPIADVLEQRIAALEGGTAAVAVGSGHAAMVVTLRALMRPGDELIVPRQHRGASVNPIDRSLGSFGWVVRSAVIDDVSSFESAVSPKTKAILIESITDSGAVADIEAIAGVAKRGAVPLIVANTLATPYLCRPFEFGADIAVHSTTGFIGGHGDSAGAVIVDGGDFNWMASDRYPMLSAPQPEYNDVVLGETFGNFAFAAACRMLGLGDAGPTISRLDAFTLLAGIETLPLRMQRHSDNATAVAEFLVGHDKVSWVQYAGMAGDRYHQLARKYCPKGAGAVLTFGVEGNAESAIRLASGLRLFSRSAGIGDARSLIGDPWSAAHTHPRDEARKSTGPAPGVLWLSVGIEDVADIIADLDQALAKV